MEEIIPKLQEWITFYGLKVLAAIIIFIVWALDCESAQASD